jgi:hypothetical protein
LTFRFLPCSRSIPKSLIGQWQNELLHLFGIEAREGQSSFVAAGVYVVGREFAGSERGSEAARTFTWSASADSPI